MLAHCRSLIDATAEACVAVKPQLARFEVLGSAGWAVLQEVWRTRAASGLLVIADGKRGDIDVTAEAYAGALIGGHRYALRPCRRPRRRPRHGQPADGSPTRSSRSSARRAQPAAGVLVLVRTLQSRRGGLRGSAARRRGTRVGAHRGDGGRSSVARTWARGGLSDVGAVVGATAPEHLARARELMPQRTFLLPGIGAQGGRVEASRARRSRRAARAVWCPPRAASRRPIARAAASRRRLRAPRPNGCARRPGRSRRTDARRAFPLACMAPGNGQPSGRFGRRVQSHDDHHGHAQRGDRQVAGGAELQARATSPHRRPAHDGGRQGRQHRAHAQGARPARDRHRLRRRRDRHAHRRAAHRGVDPQRLRAHPRGVAHEHLGARSHHRRADRDQRTGSGGLRARGRAVSRQARSTWRAAPRSWCSPARCREAWSRISTPRWCATSSDWT